MRIIILLTMMTSYSLIADDSLGQKLGLLAAQPKQAAPEEIEICNNPKASLITFLESRAPDAIKCFEKGSYSDHELAILAERLSEILRIYHISINLNNVSDDPNYRDNYSKKKQYNLSPELKGVYLQKIGNIWVFPEEIFPAINNFYKHSRGFTLAWFYNIAPLWFTADLFNIEGFSLAQIFLLLFLIVLGFCLRFFVAWLIRWQGKKLVKRTGFYGSEAALRKASWPAGNLLMAVFIGVFLPVLDLNLHISYYLALILKLFVGISGILLCYHAMDVISYLFQEHLKKTKGGLDTHLVSLLGKGLKIAVVIIGAIFVLQNLNVDVTSLLAGVTIGGLAFSFAAKDTVANLFGSLTIFTDKPFLVGESIKIADVEGTVEAIGFRSTKIRTTEGSLVSIPNSKFTDSVVENWSLRKSRKTSAVVAVAMNTSPSLIEAFCEGVRELINEHKKTIKTDYDVHFMGFGESSFKIMLAFYTDTKNQSEELRVRHEIYLSILRLAERLQVQLAMPTQLVYETPFLVEK